MVDVLAWDVSKPFEEDRIAMIETRFGIPAVAIRRSIILVLTVIAALLACARQPELNVILITIDTLRADHLSCYGYPKETSPNIDAFAREGAMFEKVACQSSQTLPSHAAIMIGTNPRTNKTISHESPVDPNVTTLSEILRDHGYRTAAFVSSHALDSKYRLDQGFNTYWEVHKERTYEERRLAKEQEQDPTLDEAVKWLRQNGRSKFFLWVHWFHPHRPYDPPPRYRERFAGGYTGTATSDPGFIMDVWKGKVELSKEDVAHLAGLYDGEVAFTDDLVGRLLREIDAMGLAENTVVVITADHGELLYEHEHYFGHDIALYDECIMIPLIIYSPILKVAEPRVGEFVQSLDIMPTLLEMLEIARPGDLEGKSLMPLIVGGGTSTVDYAFSETFPFPEKCPPRHAVRTAGAKLIWKERRDEDLTKEFYDLTQDPGETVNLYDKRPGAARLDSVLARWIQAGGLHPAAIPTARESGRWQILKSLGYVD
jgi:arylsulfatase A-like enzyme